MNLIDSLKAKAESERANAEQELPLLAERVAHGQATEKEITAWVKASGKNLDDLQVAVDRQLEIDRLNDLAAQYRERAISTYRHNLELQKFLAFQRKTIVDLEAEESKVRCSGWHLGSQATESREAFAKLSQMTGVLHPVPKLSEDYRTIDAEFAVEVVVDAVAAPVASEVELPSV